MEKRERQIAEHIFYVLGDDAKMKKFQWQIDAVRKKSKTALGSTIALFNWLLDMVYADGGLLDHCEALPRTTAELNKCYAGISRGLKKKNFTLVKGDND